MIKVTDREGRTTFLAPAAVASVTEAAASSQWHGIRCYIRTFDGKTVEATETAQQIADQIEKAHA